MTDTAYVRIGVMTHKEFKEYQRTTLMKNLTIITSMTTDKERFIVFINML